MYEKGLGVRQDYFKARQWYEQAAAAGDTDAQFNLGLLYDQGLGVKQDHAKAREWWEQAAEAGNALAQHQLDDLDRYEYLILPLKAAFDLGNMYQGGLGVRPDYAKAREWYEKAAAGGNDEAQFNLGVYYENGLGDVKQDYAKAREWYEQAAENGHVKAQYSLAWFYLMGLGGKQDSAKAREWLTKAADGGELFASLALGYLYQGGLEDYWKLAYYWKKDLDQARQWYSRAAVQGWR